MTKGRVLVIDDDEWVCRLLSVAMREAGFEISLSESAADGFFRAVEEQPDCIVCDVDLPDHSGYWVARRIRSHPSRVSTIPFVFLSGLDDREHRLEGFQVGGDAYLTKPFRIDEVVAQVEALIQMAARLRTRRQTMASIPPSGAAMTGDLGQMSVATLLTLLDLERRSGRLELKKEGRRAVLVVLSGNVISTTLDETPSSPLQTLRTTLNWDAGKFTFIPSTEPATSEFEHTPINALLMEAARLEDEARKDDPDATSSRIASVLARAPTISTQPPSSINLEYVAAAAQPTPHLSASNAVPPPAPPTEASDPAAQLLAGDGLPPEDDETRQVEVPVRPPLGERRPPLPPLKSSATLPKATLPGAPKPLVAKPLPPPMARSMTPTSATPATVAAANTTTPGTPKPGPAGARTAFGAALRSLSPSRPMRALTPQPAVPSQIGGAAKPPIEKAEPKELGPAPAPPTESIDDGWSLAPEGNEDETKKPGKVE